MFKHLWLLRQNHCSHFKDNLPLQSWVLFETWASLKEVIFWSFLKLGCKTALAWWSWMCRANQKSTDTAGHCKLWYIWVHSPSYLPLMMGFWEEKNEKVVRIAVQRALNWELGNQRLEGRRHCTSVSLYLLSLNLCQQSSKFPAVTIVHGMNSIA